MMPHDEEETLEEHYVTKGKQIGKCHYVLYIFIAFKVIEL